MSEVFLVSACRTPVGRFQGGLAGFSAPQLGAMAVREALSRAGVDGGQVDEVILGNVLQAGVGQNPARQAQRAAGIPDSVPPFTVNKVCGSGLKSVMLAAQSIKAGDNAMVVAGGMESMSRAPYLVPSARTGARLGDAKLVDSMVHDGLWDIYNDFHMGITGENVAEKYEIKREEQDAYAAQSHAKAARAQRDGDFAEEILPVEIPQRKKDPIQFALDESVRSDTTVESLAKLRPAFKKGGTVTAGNAPGCNDGAAACVVVSERIAKESGVTPIARIVGYATGGVAPEWVMMAPVEAINKLNKALEKDVSAYDLIELNEAFSVQALGVMRELELDASRVNVNGGAVAIGHPIGASGARIFTTLLHAMKARNARTGLASLCLGGGNAVAMGVEAC